MLFADNGGTKLKKGMVINMYYAIYLVGVSCMFLLSAILFRGDIDMVNLLRLLDYRLLTIIILVCFLTLFCTKLLKPFARSFSFVFGKCKLSKAECGQCLLSIKAVTTVSLLYGVMQSAIEFKHFTDAVMLNPGAIDSFINLPMISIIYALLVCIILLPIQIALKKQLI